MGLVAAELMVKIGCDTKEFDSNMSKANQSTSTFGDTFKALLSSNIITKVFGMAVQGAVSAAKAFVGFIKDVVNLYGEYEQLQGGAQLMFGEGYDYIAEKAKTAYKDVQLSQNDYLKQVNGFAVGLRESLGGNELAAAQLSDRIVTAEADIVAATGRTQEDVQNAFNGIMKSNFTMLDNLGLGIKPTKEGFQEVIDKVNEWNAANGRATSYQIDNLADCEAALVDYVEMQGLAGYAAEEAGGTVQGSIAQVKAAWENLKIGLGDPSADVGELVDAVIEAGKNALENLLPVIQNALQGIAELIKELVPIIEENMPWIEENLLPAIEDLVSALIDIAVTVIIDLMPEILDAVQQIWDAVLENLEENHPILAGILEGYAATTTVGLTNMTAEMIQIIIDFFINIIQSIQEKLEEIKTWISDKWEEIKNNAREKWESIKTAISDKWEEIKTNVQEKVEAVRSFVEEKWETMKTNAQEKWENNKSTVRDKMESMRTIARDKAESIRSALSEKWDSIRESARQKWENIKSAIREKIDAITSIFPISIGDMFGNIRLPHIDWHWHEIVGFLKFPVFDGISWYAKGYDNPFLLDSATILGQMGFGDRGNYNGGELVYGHDNLMDDIREATAGGGGDITINIYPRADQSEEDIAKAVQKQLVRWSRQKGAAFA